MIKQGIRKRKRFASTDQEAYPAQLDKWHDAERKTGSRFPMHDRRRPKDVS